MLPPSCLLSHLLCLCRSASGQLLAANWALLASQQPSPSSPSAYGQTCHTSRSGRLTFLPCLLCLLLSPLLPYWVSARASTSMGEALVPCTFACRNFPIVSFCYTRESMDAACTARWSQRVFGQIFCIDFQRCSTLSPNLRRTNLCWSKQLFQQLYVPQRSARIILVLQPSHASNSTSALILRTISKASKRSSMRETRSPWGCLLILVMSAQLSRAATRGMSDSEIG